MLEFGVGGVCGVGIDGLVGAYVTFSISGARRRSSSVANSRTQKSALWNISNSPNRPQVDRLHVEDNNEPFHAPDTPRSSSRIPT